MVNIMCVWERSYKVVLSSVLRCQCGGSTEVQVLTYSEVAGVREDEGYTGGGDTTSGGQLAACLLTCRRPLEGDVVGPVLAVDGVCNKTVSSLVLLPREIPQTGTVQKKFLLAPPSGTNVKALVIGNL